MTPEQELRALLHKLPNPARALELLDKVNFSHVTEWLCDTCSTVYPETNGPGLTGLNCRCGKGVLRSSSFNQRKLEQELAEATESMHAQDKTIATLRQQLAEAQEKAPVLCEPDMIWNADDLEEGGYSPDEFADYVAPGLGEESVFEVAVAVSLPNRTMRVWREPDADGHHKVRWEWVGKSALAASKEPTT